MDFIDGCADGFARARAFLQRQARPGHARDSRALQLSGADGGRYSDLRQRHCSGWQRSKAAHRNHARSGRQDERDGFGEIFKLPEPRIQAATEVVPGIDGQKMSKSYGNNIDIFGDEKETRKRIMSIVTDSTPVEAPKDPSRSTIFQLYSLVASKNEIAEMRERFQKGGAGYGDFKKQLFEKLWDYFAPMRKRREEILADKSYIDNVLARGAKRANEVADEVMERVRTRSACVQRFRDRILIDPVRCTNRYFSRVLSIRSRIKIDGRQTAATVESMATLRFHVVPNAKIDSVSGRIWRAIKIKLRAPAVEGKANAALRQFPVQRIE